MPRLFWIPSVVLLVACAPEPELTPMASVEGRFERLDPDDPGSRWIGVEHVTLSDAFGTCTMDRNLEATDAALSCARCRLALDVVDHELDPRAEGCTSDLYDAPRVGRYLTLVPDEVGGDSGLVQVADQTAGAWRDYSLGELLADGTLVYRHWTPVVRHGDEAFDRGELRNLPGPPLQVQ